MKVLWLCNIMLPVVAEALKREASNKEGWLTGLSQQVLRHAEENNIELGICFPIGKNEEPVKGRIKGLSYFAFSEDTGKAEAYDTGLEPQLAKILKEFAPDIVHAFGTEFPHTLAMTRCVGVAAGRDKEMKMLIGIQGLCFKYADYYMADLPKRVQKRFLLRDFLKQDNLIQQQKKYVARGRFEIEALQNTGHVTGRTDWDRQAAAEVNPEAEYHFMNETLRANFYGPEWSLNSCERYSVFLSQGNYPIKGLHYLLKAMPEILKRFPQTRVYVAGDVITRYRTVMEKIKIGSYGKYCLKLIRQFALQDRVVFLGRLGSEEMCERYLKSNLFLSPSAIENSPNSVGEAMLLGMPVVSSAVGGVANMLTDGKEGILYPYEDTGRLVEAVCRMLGEEAFACECGKRAREHALKTHDAETNYQRLLAIYNKICS